MEKTMEHKLKLIKEVRYASVCLHEKAYFDGQYDALAYILGLSEQVMINKMQLQNEINELLQVIAEKQKQRAIIINDFNEKMGGIRHG